MLVATVGISLDAQQTRGNTGGDGDLAAADVVLTPTDHPAWPRELAQIWLAPSRGADATHLSNAAVAAASKSMAAGEYEKALNAASQPGAALGPLGQYATYYAGLAQLNLEKAAAALDTFRSLRKQEPVGYLAEAAPFGEADAAVALNRPADAVAIYERMLEGKPSRVDVVLMRLGRAYNAAGNARKAAEAFARVYCEFPLGDQAEDAASELKALSGLRPIEAGSERYKLELGRAQRLFSAGRYADARNAFDALDDVARGDDREVVRLRRAESDYFLRRLRGARDALQPLTANASRRAEALYFYASASRDLGAKTTFLRTVRRIIAEYPSDSWAEESLNALGTYYIIADEDDLADQAFRDLYEKFPTGERAERAAWKVGWRAFRQDNYKDTVRYFEQGAADFPRSDYRPSWLYWAGRAHEALGERADAESRYKIVIADYLNSYYGRLAVVRLGKRADIIKAQVMAARPAAPPESSLPANAVVIRALLSAEMYSDAQNELTFARRVWGDSSAIEATVAWTNQQQARHESGSTRFQLVRGAINAMRRAYPQYMAAGGENLPRDVQTVIFPIAYWDLIRKYARAHDLDPYLVAALVAQESTFVADIRSHANAYGLTQLLPSTARQYARKLRLRYSSRLLTDPEANIRMGTAYFADKIEEFGDVHLALASYNAGERAVRQWLAERPGLPRDEFIDDIPYPETQGYVRKILGTADDYRRLYSGDTAIEGVDKTPVKRPARSAAPARSKR
jgi:soluble lytic murein transglycosylase